MKLALPMRRADELAPRLRALLPDATWVTVAPTGEVQGDGAGVEVWLWGFTRSSTSRVIAQLPDLRWIHTVSAGVNQVIVPELAERGILLTNSAGAYARPIAESVIGYILAVAKQLPRQLRNQERAIWQPAAQEELPGMTLGVLGLGSIGRTSASLARAFGMRTIGTVRHPRELPEVDRVYPATEAAEVAAESDFLLVAAPCTRETEHLVDEALLRRMKPGAWLINIARGCLVDEMALLAALEEGRIGGACLDVFEQEPLPPESPLWRLPNVIITPHNSGWTRQAMARATDMFFDNLRRYVAGEPLHNIVDQAAGY